MIARQIFELSTPAAVVDMPTLERNIGRVAAAAGKHGVVLRPHAKTHKSIDIARLQLAAGAIGITVAKLSEAERFADAGLDDLFVCYPIIGTEKLDRLFKLATRARVRTIVETEEQAKVLSRHAARVGAELDVTVDVDTGLGRVGVQLGEPLDRLVETVRGLPSLQLRGISTHEGFVYAIPDPGERKRTVRERLAPFLKAGTRLGVEVVSIGATPSLDETMKLDGVTESRPGNYVFFDAMQVALGAARPEDCALTVLSAVVSVREGGRAIIDAGSKSLSADAGVHGLELMTGYGSVSGRPDVSVTGLSEEHGWISFDESIPLRVGDRIRIVPNHACATFANFEHAYAADGDAVLGTLGVTTRGALT